MKLMRWVLQQGLLNKMATTYIITEDGNRIITEDALSQLITESSDMSIRYDIIQEIKSILEDISVANGFNTNVAFVSDKMKIEHPEELDGDELPACFILDEAETKEPLAFFGGTGEDMTSTLSISVTSIVFSRTGDTILARTDLMVDIEKAIVGDAGLLALLIEPASPTVTETDQGYFGNYSVFKQTFDCVYIYEHATGGA